MRKKITVLVSVFTLLSFLSCGLKKPPEPMPVPKVEKPIKKPDKGGYELAE